jgi:carbamate kinase
MRERLSEAYDLAFAGPVVLALGGNAIVKSGQRGDIYEQFAATRESVEPLVSLISDGANLVITHGNGPQVGDLLIMVESARDRVPELPLGVLVADTQGQMGYMIQQTLKNRLARDGINRDVVTVVTQVLVDRDDPKLREYTKPVGPFMDEAVAKLRMAQTRVRMVEDSGRGWRRVVPSPEPVAIVEIGTIKNLIAAGVIVVTAGGGGIPVYYEKDGRLEGVDAVIDKDRASAVLARDLGAPLFITATSIDKVYLNFNGPDRQALDLVTLEDAKRYYGEGHFAPGSMGPKVESIISFLEGGGRRAVVTTPWNVLEALRGRAGTHFVRG